MNALILKLLIVLGLKREDSIETITKPMAAIVSKLTSYAEEQVKRSEADKVAAEELLKKSKAEGAAAADAVALASRYSALTI